MEELASWLRATKYPQRLIDDTIASAMNTDRQLLFYPEPVDTVDEETAGPKLVYLL